MRSRVIPKPISPEQELYGPLQNSNNQGENSSINKAVDEIDKHMSWLATCFMPPKPPWQSLCENCKDKINKLEQCIESKKSWGDRWEPNRHKTFIEERIQEIVNLKDWIKKFCKDYDCNA